MFELGIQIFGSNTNTMHAEQMMNHSVTEILCHWPFKSMSLESYKSSRCATGHLKGCHWNLTNHQVLLVKLFTTIANTQYIQ